MLRFVIVFLFVFLTGWFCIWLGEPPPDAIMFVWGTALAAGATAAAAQNDSTTR